MRSRFTRRTSARRARKNVRRNVRRSPAAKRGPAAETAEVEAPAVSPRTPRRVRLARWGQRLRRLGKPLAVAALLGVVGYGGVTAHRFVVESPHFHVKRVKVTPTVHVTAEQVRKLAGVGARTNIFTVDLERVARRVQRHPWIARATAHRRLPDGIEIEVTEHRAAGAVLFERNPGAGGGAFYLVSPEGRAFKRAALEEIEGLPLITGLRRHDYRERGAATRARIREALALAEQYLSRGGRPPLGEVHVDPVEGLTLYTARRAVQVRLGQGNPAAKLRRLDRILRELARRGLRPRAIRLDNERHPRRVTVRLAEADPGGGR
jgi:cell division protein FtsQ